MKALFFLLLAATLATAAWMSVEGPVGVAREPNRMDQQIDAARFHLLNDTELTGLRSQAERAAAATAAASAAAEAAAHTAPPADLPSASCVEIGTFSSEAASRKLRARLAGLGMGDRLGTVNAEHATRLRVTGVDAALELRIHEVMKDFPHQELAHCAEAPAHP